MGINFFQFVKYFYFLKINTFFQIIYSQQKAGYEQLEKSGLSQY
jgi:hypothetical protein